MHFSSDQQTPIDVAGTCNNLQIVDIVLDHWSAKIIDKEDEKTSSLMKDLKSKLSLKFKGIKVTDQEISVLN